MTLKLRSRLPSPAAVPILTASAALRTPWLVFSRAAWEDRLDVQLKAMADNPLPQSESWVEGRRKNVVRGGDEFPSGCDVTEFLPRAGARIAARFRCS